MDEKTEKFLKKFTDEIYGVLGARMRTLLLYGSQASGEAAKKHSDYNFLLVVDGLKFEDLKALEKISFKLLKGNPPPLVFSTELFKSSTDVFPIEFLDMQETHRILTGEDPFHNMEIDLKNLRHECEFELKGKLLKLRQGYIASAGKAADVRNLLIGSISSFLVLLRNVVRLAGQKPPFRKLDALNALAPLVKIDTTPFENIYKMKHGDKEALKLNPEEVFAAYMKEIEKAVDFVDKFVVK